MAKSIHYVIIGNGVAGDEAAKHLRARDPASRITLVTAGKLLFTNRYELPGTVVNGGDWRDLLVHPPAYYDDQKITVRRNTWVSGVDTERQVLALRHREDLHYDKLLVASGGGGYVPEGLREFRHLMHRFGTYQDATRLANALPDGGAGKGHVVMIGGDMIGLDLARTLAASGHKMTLIGEEYLFWPHQVAADQRARFVQSLGHMGMALLAGRTVTEIKEGRGKSGARRVVLDNGDTVACDAVICSCGLMPTLNFMLGASVDIERGLLVDPKLRTTNEHIWAAGDVCQIWSPEENGYRFYYGWKNVKLMGRIAAINMTGGSEVIGTPGEERLSVITRGARKGQITSPYWQYG